MAGDSFLGFLAFCPLGVGLRPPTYIFILIEARIIALTILSMANLFSLIELSANQSNDLVHIMDIKSETDDY